MKKSQTALKILTPNQKPIIRSEKLPCVRVTAFSRTSLLLERFWREFWISFKFHKPVSKTYRHKNNYIFCLLITFSFQFDILYFECVHRHGGDSIFLEKVPKKYFPEAVFNLVPRPRWTTSFSIYIINPSYHTQPIMEKESILSEKTIHIFLLKFSKLSFSKALIFLALLSTCNLCVCLLSG